MASREGRTVLDIPDGCPFIQMTKYSDRLETADNEMQSDMAEGSAWGESDPNFDFPEASGSGSGPGECALESRGGITNGI